MLDTRGRADIGGCYLEAFRRTTDSSRPAVTMLRPCPLPWNTSATSSSATARRCGCAARGRRQGRPAGVLPRLSAESTYTRFHGFPSPTTELVGTRARSGLGRARSAHGHARQACGRRGELRPAAGSRLRRGCVHGRGRASGAGDRYAPARAARRPRGRPDRVIRRRRHDLESTHAGRLRGRRVRCLARVRAGRRRGSAVHRADGGTGSAWTSATTSPSWRPCSRSSRRESSPSWAHRQDAARSAASSSATSSRPTSRASSTRSISKASRSRACARTPASRTSPTPSISRSSASRGARAGGAEDALGAGTKVSASSPLVSPRSAEGVARQEQLVATARTRRAARRAELPRHRGHATSPERDVRTAGVPSGNVALSSQSGALGLALLEAATLAELASPRSSPSATRRTCRRTTCSSTGRTMRSRRSCCSTSSRSATP